MTVQKWAIKVFKIKKNGLFEKKDTIKSFFTIID